MRKKSDIYREIEENFGMVPGWARQMPDAALEGFWSLMRDFTMAETKIPNKYKELIGLGVAGATRDRFCALFHTEGARMYGATDAEIAEASAMASFAMMGSTFLHAQQVDYEVFRQETLGIVAYAKAQMAQQGVVLPGRADANGVDRGRH